MMKIIQTDRRSEDKTKIKNRKHTHVSGTRDSLFASEIANRIDYIDKGSIEEMMSDLKDQEERFLDTQSLYELTRYKTIIRKVLKRALDESFTVKKLKRSKSDRADFTIVNKINNKLQEISDAIIKSNKAFDLMKAIEEIRGLILDLSY